MADFVGWVKWVYLPTEPMIMLKYGVLAHIRLLRRGWQKTRRK